MTRRAVHVRITGIVQGVGYRDWTARKAGELGLGGWVRNRMDGSVEAVVAGSEAAVMQMLEACHDGPRAAEVDAVEVTEWTEPVGEGFDVLRTA
jgi:acylphosphatase